ncbi:MAG: hypothetical protein V2I41_14200 [Pseudomonadales bacterium]|jgi:hypothetical protein|nr:hypothetical protein [Pseudomonadales bacterium]
MSQSRPEQSALDAMTSGGPDYQAIAPLHAAALAEGRLIESSELLGEIEP